MAGRERRRRAGGGRAGAPSFSLGARRREGGVGSRTSDSMRSSRLRWLRKAAAGPRLLPLLSGAGAGAGDLDFCTGG